MDINYLIKVLLRKKVLLFTVTLFSVLIAFFITKQLEAEYKSSAQISTGFTTKEDLNIVNENFTLREAGIRFTNLIETMKSPIIVDLVSYRLLLNDLNAAQPFRNQEKQRFERYFQMYSEPLDKKKIEQISMLVQSKLDNAEQLNAYIPAERGVIELLKSYNYNYGSLIKSLKVDRYRNSDNIEIQFLSENPFLSAYVVNALSEEIIKYQNNLRSNRNAHSIEFYEKLLEQKKKAFDENVERRNLLKSSSNISDLGFQSNIRINQIKDYEIKRNEALDRISALEFQIESINTRINNLNESGAISSNERIVELRKKIEELNKMYIDTGSKNIDLGLMISELRDQLHFEMNKIQSTDNPNANNDIRTLVNEREDKLLELRIAKSSLTSIENTLAKFKSDASGISTKESEIAAIDREVETLMGEYLTVLNEYNQEKNKSLITKSSLSVIVAAQPSEHPEASKKIIIIGLAGLVSFILAVVSIIFLEYVDQRIKTPNIFEAQTNLLLYGAVNLVNIKKLHFKTLFSSNKLKPDLEAFKQFLRKIRFEILSVFEKNRSKIFLFTSLKRGEGKTFVIIWLAYSLSKLNKKVLIIDTNFKNNTLTKILLPREESNLLEYSPKMLTDANFEPSDASLSNNLITHTHIQNIDLIGSRSVIDSPSEIFSEKKFSDMLSYLNKQYDFIFLEGAAINDFSDTKELIQYVDKVIPIFSADNSIGAKDKTSIKYLKELNGKLAGSILNKVILENLNI